MIICRTCGKQFESKDTYVPHTFECYPSGRAFDTQEAAQPVLISGCPSCVAFLEKLDRERMTNKLKAISLRTSSEESIADALIAYFKE